VFAATHVKVYGNHTSFYLNGELYELNEATQVRALIRIISASSVRDFEVFLVLFEIRNSGCSVRFF